MVSFASSLPLAGLGSFRSCCLGFLGVLGVLADVLGVLGVPDVLGVLAVHQNLIRSFLISDCEFVDEARS